PIRHGQFGVELRGALEGAGGFVVIEGVDEPQALVEEGLRLRVLGGDRMMPIAVAGHERGGFWFGGGGVVGVLLREGRNRQRKNEGEQNQDAAMHWEPPVNREVGMSCFADCSIAEMAGCKRGGCLVNHNRPLPPSFL